MREKLQATIERAFIDLHYAEAELGTSRHAEDGLSPAIDHIRLAIRELQSAIEPLEDSSPSETPSS